MQRLIVTIAAILTILTTMQASAAPTAFVNVNVIPMTGEKVIAGQTVIVDAGRIAAIGDVEQLPVPDGALLVDGTDRFLMPGLAEMHAHVTSARGEPLDRLMSLFLANGVTTIRGMLGRPSHLQLREDLLAGRVSGPRLITSGPSLNGRSVDGAADGRRQVMEQHAAGYDFLKIHPGLSAAEFEAIADAANELGIPFAGHVPVAVGVGKALASGIATIDHLDGYMAALLPANYDPSGGYGGFFDILLADQVSVDRIADIAAATARAGTWNVPTESLIEQLINDVPPSELRNREDMQYESRETVEQWVNRKQRQRQERGFSPELAAKAIDIRRRLILALHRAGAGLLLGSDAPQVFNVPGFSIHHELEFFVAAGLTPFEALQTGTTSVAGFLGLNTGSVIVGREADLVLLDANPLDDIRHTRRIHGVMWRGNWISSAELARRLDRFVATDSQ